MKHLTCASIHRLTVLGPVLAALFIVWPGVAPAATPATMAAEGAPQVEEGVIDALSELVADFCSLW